MIHITTAFGSSEAITPGAIATGGGDGWLIGLNGAIAGSGLVTYARLMAEMDGSWNLYSAYNSDGSRRDGAHSTAALQAGLEAGHTKSRTQMVVYNQCVNPHGPFRLWRDPNAARALRHALANPKYLAYAPEF